MCVCVYGWMDGMVVCVCVGWWVGNICVCVYSRNGANMIG